MVTKSSLWTQLSNALAVIDYLLQNESAGADSFLTRLQALELTYEGNHIATTSSKFASLRTSLNNVLLAPSTLDALIIELARVGYASQNTSVLACLSDIYSGMTTAIETVKHRDYTYGAFSYSGTGNGQLYRQVIDASGLNIEKGHTSTGAFQCKIINDAFSGADTGQERAIIEGTGLPPVDSLEPGEKPGTVLYLIAKQSANGLLRNGDFALYSLVGSTYTLNYWTINDPDASAFSVSTVEYYRKGLTGNGYGVIFTLDNSITQSFSNLTADFDTSKPVFFIVRYKRLSSCDGQLILTLGSKNETILDLTVMPNNVWTDLVFGITNPADTWHENFNTSSPTVKIELASRTTGSLALSDIILAQGDSYDGKFYLLTAGEDGNDFLVGDKFTWTDLVANTGRIQTTIARLYDRYLPHTNGVPTYADV